MKDIVISGNRIKAELIILAACYLLANMLNAFSIWFYETRWIEMLTFQRLMIVITFCFYGLTWLGRGLWLLGEKLLNRRKTI